MVPHTARGLETWQLLIVRKEPLAMSSSRLIRLSGLAALVGFALIPILQVARVIAFPDTLTLSAISVMDTFFVLNLLIVIAMLLGLLGLIGIYARQAEQTGVLGLIAFLVTFF